jgi:hypothetical protein
MIDMAFAKSLALFVVSPLERFAGACTVWGELFTRPDCGFVQSGKKRE